MRQFATNSPELRKQIEDNENGLWKISGTSPTGEDMNDSGILQDVLVSDRATVHGIGSSLRTVMHQAFIRRCTGQQQFRTKDSWSPVEFCGGQSCF